MITGGSSLRLDERDHGWALAGPGSAGFVLVNEYLAYLGDRNYSPKTVRAYGFDLLAFCRWLAGENIVLAAVTTDVLLRFLSACREARVPGRPGGPNVVTLGGRRVVDDVVERFGHLDIVLANADEYIRMRRLARTAYAAACVALQPLRPVSIRMRVPRSTL